MASTGRRGARRSRTLRIVHESDAAPWGTHELVAAALLLARVARSVDGESPILSPPGIRVGFVDPDSVDFAGHRGVTARTDGSVLGGCSVAQRRVPVPQVVVSLEVPDHHSGLHQGVPVIAVEALLA